MGDERGRQIDTERNDRMGETETNRDREGNDMGKEEREIRGMEMEGGMTSGKTDNGFVTPSQP